MIRERRAEDDAAIAQVVREAAPGWVTTEAGVRHRRLTTPEGARRGDWVAEADAEVVGWASGSRVLEIARDDVAWLGVLVRPRWRRRGIGAALYERVEPHVLGVGARRLLAQADDEPASSRFAERRGFRHTLTGRLSSLAPQTVDPSALAALAAEKEAEGFGLAPFAAFADRPELIHAVDAEGSLDEPSDEPVTDVPLDDWLARHWSHPDYTHEGSFVVVHDGRPVAMSWLVLDLEGRRAANGFTATLRAYRGRGLARLAKLASIAWLRERGVTLLVTNNDETNAPMLAVNTRLGYRPFGGTRSYVKDLP